MAELLQSWDDGWKLYYEKSQSAWYSLVLHAPWKPTQHRKAIFNLGWNGLRFSDGRDQKRLHDEYPEIEKRLKMLCQEVFPED
jgi:hypothetical protein